MSMQREKTPATGEVAGAASPLVATRKRTSSGSRVPQDASRVNTTNTNYAAQLHFRLVGYFHGKAVYAPLDEIGGRVLSIEEDHMYLRAMTTEEVAEWKVQQFDLALTQRLEEERDDLEWAEEAEREKESTLRMNSGVF